MRWAGAPNLIYYTATMTKPRVMINTTTRNGGNNNKKKTKKTKTKERTLLGQALRALGTSGGTALGGYFGMPVSGGALGSSLGAAVSKWLGSGAYTVSTNSVLTEAAPTIPMMHENGQSIVVRHREFIMSIQGSTKFTVARQLVVNPGLRATFPWLSRLAGCYQQYRVRGLVYHYIPTSGYAVASTNSALGSVMLQTTYRSTESAPTSKQELLNEYWSTETVPSETLAHPLECDPKENPFQIHYVRQHGLSTSDEPLLYDLARTFVCTQGMQSTNVVGDLWATYEIELYKPVVSSQLTGAAASQGGSTTATTTAPLGGFTWTSNSLEMSNPSDTALAFPQSTGTYYVYVTYSAPGAGFTNYQFPTYTATNCDMILSNQTAFAGTSVNKPVDQLIVTISDISTVASIAFTVNCVPAIHSIEIEIFRID